MPEAEEQPAEGSLVPTTAPELGSQTGSPFGSSLGHVPMPDDVERVQSGEVGQGITPRPSKWDEFTAGASKGLHDSLGASLLRLYQENNAPQGKVLDATTANALYPGRPVLYTGPVNENVAQMEYNDRQKQSQLDEWMGRRDPTFGTRASQFAGSLAGGLADPLNLAVGGASAVLGGAAAPLLVGPLGDFAGGLAGHFLGNWAGFSAAGGIQSSVEEQMGAKPKSFGEIVGSAAMPAAIMTGVGAAFRAVLRRTVTEGAATPEAVERGVKENVAAFESDQRAPLLEDMRNRLQDRRSGVTPDGPAPTILTSPIHETPLYAATHGDGRGLVHEQGLGPGIQLTDTKEVANNGVSRSTDTPGQIATTRLPPDSKLLDIDRPGAADYSSQDSLLKAIEQKTGIPLEDAVKRGESLKDVITNLGDWAGAEIGGGKTMPDDILEQIQGIARDKGYDGYVFQGQNSRQVHLWDASELKAEEIHHADPGATQPMPDTPGQKAAMGEQTPDPAEVKAKAQGYSPDMEKIVQEFHKNHGDGYEYDPGNTAKIVAEAEELKKQLQEAAKTSPSAQAELDALREQDARDKRLADISKKITECGSGGGT